MLKEDILSAVHFGFVIIHFVWFVAYYSKYSALNQKLSGVEKLYKLKLITSELAVLNISEINQKIKSLRKRCLLPIPFITAGHLIYLYSEGFPVKGELPIVFGILTGSILMIGMANVAKGRKVMPDIKFRDTNPFD